MNKKKITSYQRLKKENKDLYQDIFLMVTEPEGRGGIIMESYKILFDMEKNICEFLKTERK